MQQREAGRAPGGETSRFILRSGIRGAPVPRVWGRRGPAVRHWGCPVIFGSAFGAAQFLLRELAFFSYSVLISILRLSISTHLRHLFTCV